MITAGQNFTLEALSSDNLGTVRHKFRGGWLRRRRACLCHGEQRFSDHGDDPGQNACITAGNNIQVAANTDSSGYATAYADGRGFGGGGYANSNLNTNGLNGNGNGLTQTEVQNLAGLCALPPSSLPPTTNNMNLSTQSEGYGAGAWVSQMTMRRPTSCSDTVKVDMGASSPGPWR